MEHFGAEWGADPSGQEFFGPLDQAAYGELPDETDQFADTLNQQVDDMQAQTGQVIYDAGHSPGFGEVNPDAEGVLHAYDTGDQIQAGAYQDFEARQDETAADDAMTGSDLAIGDAQTALDTPDGADE
jgi:hypothetical protein